MHRRRAVATVAVVGLGLQAAEPAAAHAGTTHAGTPHWLLLGATLAGAVAAVGGWTAVQDDGTSTRLGVGILVGGVLVTVLGSVGLVEIQVVPRSAPGWTRWFPVFNAVAAILVALGGLVVTRLRYPERPRYVGLALLLAVWVAYPTLLPQGGLTNPLGYLLALSVPVAVGYVLHRDARDALAVFRRSRVARLAGGLAFALFAVFFAFSSGTLTVNPDLTSGVPADGFVELYRVAAPLVYWPAVEFYVPQVPLAGYVSLGSILLIGVLGGLVGLNAALVARQWRTDGAAESPRAMVGAVTSAGATACCCCAPAVYAAVGVLFGAAASPVYWAFMDPTSPVGGLFFAASVIVLTGSAVRASGTPACRVSPGETGPTRAGVSDD